MMAATTPKAPGGPTPAHVRPAPPMPRGAPRTPAAPPAAPGAGRGGRGRARRGRRVVAAPPPPPQPTRGPPRPPRCAPPTARFGAGARRPGGRRRWRCLESRGGQAWGRGPVPRPALPLPPGPSSRRCACAPQGPAGICVFWVGGEWGGWGGRDTVGQWVQICCWTVLEGRECWQGAPLHNKKSRHSV